MNQSDESKATTPTKKALIFLIGIMFLNGLGFSVLAPVLPFIILKYISNPADLGSVVAWLSATYAFCEIVAAPGLGLLSDRFGRRPILFICLFGSTIGYIMFGLGGSLAILFLSRIIDGLTGGNFSIAFAYIADTTTPENRSKVFGQVGAASGVSFLLGPAVGGFASKISLETPAYLAAALSLLALVWGYFFLPESLHQSVRREKLQLTELNPLTQLVGVLKYKSLRPLLLIAVFYAFPFAVLGANFAVLVIDTLHWDATAMGLSSLLIGVGDITVQGWLIGKLLPIFGPRKLLVAGLFLQGVAYASMAIFAIAPSAILLLVTILVYSTSSGLVEPTLSGLTSQSVGPEQQGLVGGASQAAQALMRVVGPIWVGVIYVSLGHSIPYWINAAIMALAVVVVLVVVKRPAATSTATGPASETPLLQPEESLSR